MANPNRVDKPEIEKSEQELINKSFDREFNVLAVEALVYNPSTGAMDRMTQPGEATAKTERYDTSNSPIIYTGYAAVGTADSALGWTITKYDVSTSSAMSGKVATDVSWNNRATGTYA